MARHRVRFTYDSFFLFVCATHSFAILGAGLRGGDGGAHNAHGGRWIQGLALQTRPWYLACHGKKPCPPDAGPLEGSSFPSEDRDLPYLASWVVRIAIPRHNCAN